MTFTAAELLACAEREVKQRRRVYARLVATQSMTGKEADRQIAMMQAIADHFRPLAEAEEDKWKLV